MKRTLSFLLALVMVLGTFTTVFAAEPTVEEAAGALLEELDVLRGKGDGLLHLEDDLRREEAVVLLSRLMGVEEVAEEFPTEGLPFEDVKDAYFKTFVAWAYANKLTDGKSATKFGFNDPLTAQQYATFLLRALEYEPDYATALETAKELGLLADVEVVNSTVVKRGVMAVMTVNALGTKVNGSEETLAAKLGKEMPVEEPTLSTDIEVTAVAAIANNKVEVKVKEEVAASVADFAIVKKGTTTAVEVKGLVQESAKVFVLETEALVGGTAYTLTSNGKSINFTGIAADKSAPTVVKLSAIDTNTFEIEYSDKMDFATVTNIKNYTVDKNLNVVKAELDSSRKFATITTDSAIRGIVYSITIENIMNSDGVVMPKATRRITAIEDKLAPRVASVRAQNNRMIVVGFLDANGMDSASVEDLANYTINDLNIISAKSYDTDNDGLIETVVLMTEQQTANKAYTLTIEGVKDGSVLANVITKTAKAFRGAPEDKSSPVVVAPVDSENNNKVVINFFDNNAMDAASLEDLSNYVITFGNNEVLPVIEAKAHDTTYPKGYNIKRVTLTTAPQEINRAYRIEIKDVKDEFGNSLKPISGSNYAKYYFTGKPIDVTAPYPQKVEYVNGTTVKITFNEILNRATATDPTNYVINGKIDTVIKAGLSTNGLVVTLTTQPLADNGSYTITINNVEDSYSNIMTNVKVSFIATASALDTVAPSLVHLYAVNNQEIHLNFDEKVETPANKIQIQLGSATPIPLDYAGRINGQTTLVYKAATALATGTYDLVGTNNATDLFKDAAGNGYLPVAGSNNLIYVTTQVVNTAPEVDYIEQLDTKTLKVVFNEPVIKAATVSGYSVDADATRDTHVTEVYLNSNTNFVVGKELTLNFGPMTDIVGLASTDVAYKFTPWYQDLTPPTVIGVAAVKNDTVIVSYDEDISVTGRYRIFYYDDAGKTIDAYAGITGAISSAAPSEVRLNVAGLSSSRVYHLQVLTGARDIAGNIEQIAGGNNFDFYGSDVTTTDFIKGVSIINGSKLGVYATKSIVGLTVYELEEVNSVMVRKTLMTNLVNSNIAGDYPTDKRFSSDMPFLAGIRYEVEVDFGGGVKQSYQFTGITTDVGISLTEVSGTVTLNFPGYDENVYDVAVFNDTGVEILAKTATVAGNVISASVNKTDVVYVVLYNRLDGIVLNAAKVIVK